MYDYDKITKKRFIMIERKIKNELLRLAKYFPVVSVTGPRQSGKTTLIKDTFPDYKYINLEIPNFKEQASSDPVAFLRSFGENVIIDEAQFAPDIFSAVQVLSDINEKPGNYILSGSQNFLLLKQISQSLAGRVGILKLMPLTYSELLNSNNISSFKENIFKGGYPRLYDSKIPTDIYYKNYIETYISRDVKGYLDVRNYTDFKNLLTLLAERAGQLINYSSLAKSLQVDVRTIKSWISILTSSYICFTLSPYFRNRSKTLIKTPKIYFYDTGLLCHLLNVFTDNDFETIGYKGKIFENYVISEKFKNYYNQNADARLYFYRDTNNNEVDLIDETKNAKFSLCEIKAGETYRSKFSSALIRIANDMDVDTSNSCIVYGGENSFTDGDINVLTPNEFLL